jgi:hypothetical protein
MARLFLYLESANTPMRWHTHSGDFRLFGVADLQALVSQQVGEVIHTITNRTVCALFGLPPSTDHLPLERPGDTIICIHVEHTIYGWTVPDNETGRGDVSGQ